MKRFYILTMVLSMLGSALVAQNLASVSPAAVPQGYVGNLTITGSSTNFSVCTMGINLRLTHVQSGQFYDFGNAPFPAAWIQGVPNPNPTILTGNVTIPMGAPVGPYDVRVRGFCPGGILCIELSASNLFEVTALIGVDPQSSPSFSISPNPLQQSGGQSQLQLQWNGSPVDKVAIWLTDAQGRRVQTWENQQFSAQGPTSLSLAPLPHGIYFLELRGEGLSMTRKLVLQP
jgi:hypothetical protein